MADLADLEERLGVRFRDRDLLARAFVHRSYAFEEGGLEPNERLEFLGDAVLGLVVTTLIYDDLPEEPEGTLAKLRAAAVRTDALADVARDLGLGAYVKLGKGERTSGGAEKDSILADTFEAVLGALYLDQGFGAAFEVVEVLFLPRLRDLSTKGPALDYKTSLQELVAARYEGVPVYEVDEEGPDHDKRFVATVHVEGTVVGQGEGGSKKKAEQEAAEEAYRALAGPRRQKEIEGA